jgi:hypothetical protein
METSQPRQTFLKPNIYSYLRWRCRLPSPDLNIRSPNPRALFVKVSDVAIGTSLSSFSGKPLCANGLQVAIPPRCGRKAIRQKPRLQAGRSDAITIPCRFRASPSAYRASAGRPQVPLLRLCFTCGADAACLQPPGILAFGLSRVPARAGPREGRHDAPPLAT